MRVPAIIFADRPLIEAMDEKVREQISNVARLPGIVGAALAMPDAHWGYGFPIGGVAAFDPAADGIISAGGVGFDISCGIRMLRPRLQRADVMAVQKALSDRLAESIPAGVGSRVRPGPLAPVCRSCPSGIEPSASRSSSAARWERPPTCSPARNNPRPFPSARRATAPGGR